jgi:endonuclease III
VSTAEKESLARDWDAEFRAISDAVSGNALPSVDAIESERPDPWAVLVSTVISLRTKDSVTLNASRRLLDAAPGPEETLSLDEGRISDLIYPAGFYRTKAKNLRAIARMTIEKHDGKVPADRGMLMDLPGVGLKTANLVLSVGFGIPAICVDIHVHRIANRRGWIRTSKPEESEKALRETLPIKWWIPVNRLLVSFGQRVCKPVSPLCSQCPVAGNCPRTDVTKSR